MSKSNFNGKGCWTLIFLIMALCVLMGGCGFSAILNRDASDRIELSQEQERYEEDAEEEAPAEANSVSDSEDLQDGDAVADHLHYEILPGESISLVRDGIIPQVLEQKVSGYSLSDSGILIASMDITPEDNTGELLLDYSGSKQLLELIPREDPEQISGQNRDNEETAEEEFPVGKYRILINKPGNYVVIYAWEDENLSEPLKAMICSTGEATPSGSYTLKSRKVWNRLFGNVWGKYATVITGNILFHSVPFAEADSSTLLTEEYNLLGTAASMGCIRLRVCDSKWIYDTCEPGSIVIFSDEEATCPISYEEPIHLPEGETAWDPTDPDEENPWNTKGPEIICSSTHITVRKGGTFSLSDWIKVTDTAGNDILSEIVCDGEVDTDLCGRYILYLSCKDALGRIAQTRLLVEVE